MDRLPRELIDAILQQCVDQGPRNTVLQLRLVCRGFDRYLKPYACQTVALEFSRLSAASGRRQPDRDALQTIGKHCKALYIDLMVLRDEFEVEFLSTIFERVPTMKNFIHTLQRRYCMSETSFTEVDYRGALNDILFNCSDVERLRVNLPFQLVGQRCNAATLILANTFSAFAQRLEENDDGNDGNGPSHGYGDMPVPPLRTLVLENVSDQTIYNLWTNPIDVMNIMRVLARLDNLVLAIRRHELSDPQLVAFYGSCLWDMIRSAERVTTLCLVGNDDDRPPRGLKQSTASTVFADEWRARSLPGLPHTIVRLPELTCLELKRLEVKPNELRALTRNFGPTLRELYLNEVYLKAEQGLNFNPDTTDSLWVGLPNLRPELHFDWVAMLFRERCPELRICRAAFLGYDHFIREDATGPQPGIGAAGGGQAGLANPANPDFDFIDPCGLGRSVAQRFVEVVLGYAQPDAPGPGVDGQNAMSRPIVYLPHSEASDHLIRELKPRPDVFRVDEYDVNAYQTAVRNSTSRWQKSIDGVFPNTNSGTLEELHYIAETACQGMNEIQRRRGDLHARRPGGEEGDADDGGDDGVELDVDMHDGEQQQQGPAAGGVGAGGGAGGGGPGNGGWLAENLLNLNFAEEQQ